MVSENFDRVIDHLIFNESGPKSFRSPSSQGIWGYVNNPFDSGGATIHGVTFRSWKRFLKKYSRHDFFLSNSRWSNFIRIDERARDALDVTLFKLKDFKALTPADVKFFYHAEYWQAAGCDFLPSGVDYYIFDFAVNSGASRAVKYLQRLVGVLDDGIVGNRTKEATFEYVDANGAKRLLKELDRSRRNFLAQIKNASKFMRGWDKRLISVLEKCYELLDDVYVAHSKDLSKSRTIRTSKAQVKFVTGMAAAEALAPDQRTMQTAVNATIENLETASTVTRLIDGIYSYGHFAIYATIICFAGYHIYLRYEDWFTKER